MTVPASIGQLIERYLDGTLSKDQTRTLETWLRQNDENLAAFVRLINVHVGLQHAMAELPDVRPADLLAQPQRPMPGARPLAWRMAWPLAAAAGLLVALGLSIMLRTERIAGDSFVVAQIVRCEGDAVRQTARGASLRLEPAEKLERGDRLLTRAGGRATIRSLDGSEIDLDENTQLRMANASDPHVVALDSGRIYCAVAPRAAGAVPFVVGLKSGARAVALGTRFELAAAPDSPVRLAVDEGAVRLESPAAPPREITALQAVSLSAAGIVAPAEYVPRYAIATWKFKPDSVPDGTILLREDFEDPDRFAERLAPRMPGATHAPAPDAQPWWRVADGKGTSGSRGLVLSLEPKKPVVLMFLPEIRHRHVELSFDFRGSQAGLFYLGPIFQLPGVSDAGHLACKMGGGASDDVTPQRWMNVQVRIRGNTMLETWREGNRVVHEAWGHVSDTGCSYARIGFCARLADEQTQPMEFWVDNFVLRKIAPEPYPEVLFHDAFNPGTMDNWKVSLGTWSIAKGQSATIHDGDCLQLDWNPGERAAIFANLDLKNRDFELRFFVKTPTAVAYAPVLSVSATDLSEALDIKPTGGGFVSGRLIPHNEWCLHRFIVQGRTVRHIATHKGEVFYDRSARITDPRPFVYAGLFFDKARERCKVYVDSVSILRMEQ